MMIDTLCRHLLDHQIGIIEHDTIPGIVGLLTPENAQRIVSLKQRSAHKGFIVLVPSVDHVLDLVAQIPQDANPLMTRHWPGPLTMIFPKNPSLPDIITGSRHTIAIRYPDHPLLTPLLTQLNQPILSTSANMSGESSLSPALLLAVDFTAGDLHAPDTAMGSTIVDVCESPYRVIRQGLVVV